MSEKFEGGVPPQERKKEVEIKFGRYPDRRSAASAIAGAIASEDPEYKESAAKVQHYEEWSKGTRYAKDERELDSWKSEVRERWHSIYDRAMTLAEEAMEEVANEVQNGELQLNPGYVDDEETRNFWRAEDAMKIAHERTVNKLNSTTK